MTAWDTPSDGKRDVPACMRQSVRMNTTGDRNGGSAMLLRVGELAKRTGLTVRTLHHYDAIGLLNPSARSQAGYRLYNNEDIARLHGIQGLRDLGLPLSDIGRQLAANGTTLPEIISRQLAALDREILRVTDVRSRLTMLQQRLTVGTQPETDDWLAALQLMTTHGKYFTSDELKVISERWQEMTADWQPLIKELHDAMKEDIPADASVAQMLARRWMNLSMRWMQDDFALLTRWKEMCENEPAAYGNSGIDAESFQYIGNAVALRVAAFQKYLDPLQIKRLNKNLDEKWDALEQAARNIMRQGLAADSEVVRRLAVRWDDLVDETADHDPVIREKLLIAIENEPLIRSGSHLSADVREFIGGAVAFSGNRQSA
ncbi:MAG TPA: MerR family transcriptional regulator [Oxalobacteraceae bacterium]|nr:MerR family transcriptional regulator [Oxalobacteraceae bacterium]